MLRFAYSTINWGDTCDLPTALAEIRQAGWSAVELFAHTLDWLGPREQLLAHLDGLVAATLFGVIDLPSDAKQLTIHKHRIDYAASLGATAYGLVGGGRLRWRAPTDAEYADLARLCEELAGHGAECGVTVAYHPHVGCTIETEAEIDRLLDQTSTLQLCLDASHIALVGEDPILHLRKYRERLGYIHLKDWARGAFVEIGQGTLAIDFPAILRELEQQQFAGWVVVEQSRSDSSPRHSAQVNAEYLTGLGYRLA
jgi:inosose dehydratase